MIPALAALGLMLGATSAQAAQDGKAIFQQKCAGCHSVGGGRMVGPDLKGVTMRRKHDWLVAFISGPDKVIAADDPTAKQLLKDFGEMPMPTVGLSKDEIEAVLASLATPGAAAPSQAAPVSPAGDAKRGEAFFTGAVHLENGGVACISCHNAGAGALGGGSMGNDLTGVYGRMGQAGLDGALKTLPFPVMKEIYKDRALTNQEVADLEAFFKQANEKPVASHGASFAGIGVLGALGLFGGMGLFWPRRRQGVREKLLGGKK